MNERLIVRNFAGLKKVDLSLGEINILIGPQATGKSICAKSLYFFKSFFSEMAIAIESEYTKRQFDSNYLAKFESYFSTKNYDVPDFSLRYEIGEHFIQVAQIDGKLKLSYSDYYKQQLSFWKKQFKSTLEKFPGDKEAPRRFDTMYSLRRSFLAHQQTNCGKIASYNQVFIPAGRSFFALLQRSIFSFLSSNNAIDPFLTEFGSFYESIKRPHVAPRGRDDKDKALTTRINTLIESILRGRHVAERGSDFLILPDGRKISIAISSSGQQEMLPLAVILSTLPFFRTVGSGGNVVYIEEPEAHLFPTAQRSIVELIAMIYNCSKVPTQFVITTHSPYILASFNNLLQAGIADNELKSSEEREQLRQIVPADLQLKSENLHIYSLKNGGCESLMSEETGLISTSMLDSVSDDLAVQFDSILNLE